MAALQAEGIACRRGERLLFADIRFALSAGELLLLRGPNGSGKSSLLRLIAGLLPAESGRLLWNGRDVTEQKSDYRNALAFLGHQDSLKPQLTLRDNLAFWADLAGSDADLDAILARVGLSLQADLPAQYLSAGQRRRFGLGRLLLRPAPIWLLDEPTTALDADGVRLALDLIRQHLAAGGLALVASHEMLDFPGAAILDFARRV